MATDAKIQSHTINIPGTGQMQEHYEQRKNVWRPTMTFMMQRKVDNRGTVSE